MYVICSASLADEDLLSDKQELWENNSTDSPFNWIDESRWCVLSRLAQSNNRCWWYLCLLFTECIAAVGTCPNNKKKKKWRQLNLFFCTYFSFYRPLFPNVHKDYRGRQRPICGIPIASRYFGHLLQIPMAPESSFIFIFPCPHRYYLFLCSYKHAQAAMLYTRPSHKYSTHIQTRIKYALKLRPSSTRK